MKVMWFFLGIALGVVVGFTIPRPQPIDIPTYVTEQIVLTIPKTEKELEKQLLYLAASRGMLEELHRQKVLRR